MCGVPEEDTGVANSHTHCDSCFRVTAACLSSSNCPTISCEHGCGQLFHSCKAADHQLICPAAVVQCINAEHGCPVRLQRHLRGQHLKHCCASVVVCSAVWCRRLSLDGATCRKQVALPARDISPAALAAVSLRRQLAYYDQYRLLASEHTSAPASAEKARSRNVPQELDQEVDYDRYSETECVHGLGGNLCRLCHRSDKEELENGSGCDEQKVRSHWECSPCSVRPGTLVWTRTNSTPSSDTSSCGDISCQSAAVERRAVLALIRQYQQIKHRKAANSWRPRLSHHFLQLSETSENVAAETSAALQRHLVADTPSEHFYRLQCEQLMRRDQIADHYALQHVCLVGESLTLFCPLRVYGCDYFVNRLVADLSSGSDLAAGSRVCLRHHVSLVDAHVAYCVSTGASCHGNAAAADTPLTSLPDEPLLTILSLLDSCSLRQVALTCRRFRSLCASIVHSRGMAVIEWQRPTPPVGDGESRWLRESQVRWRFSRHCETTSTQFRVVSAHMADHLSMCQFRQANIQTERFSILPSGTHRQQHLSEESGTIARTTTAP